MDRQTLRDWVIRFNEQGPDGLINVPAPGAPAKLNKGHRAFLARIVDEGPIPAIHGVVRWRLCDLVQWVQETHGISISEDTISRYLRASGYRKLSARPRHHAQNPEALTAFKKTSVNAWRRSRRAMLRASR